MATIEAPFSSARIRPALDESFLLSGAASSSPKPHFPHRHFLFDLPPTTVLCLPVLFLITNSIRSDAASFLFPF